MSLCCSSIHSCLRIQRSPFARRTRPFSPTTHNSILRSIAMASNKSVLVPIADGSEEMEAIIIADVLRRAQAEVTIASTEGKEQVTCSRGVKIVADTLIEDCVSQDYDLVVLPGGMPGAEHLRDSKALVEILRKQQSSNKPLAAICAAPQVVLDSQGFLQGRKATAHPAFSGKLSNQDSVEERVVMDSGIVTSRGPGTAFEFALSLVSMLYGPEKMKEVAGPMVMHDTWENSIV
jgi:4-methyl-5(b-hydroxyethyl)-thiazole monophosphate biosynthesis